MFEQYSASLATNLGIELTTLILVILIWDLTWRCVGVWKSSRNNQPIWSIAFVLFQTIGILPILYIFVFSKMNKAVSPITPIKLRAKKKTKRKK